MANKIVRETIHAKGIDIGIYTNDFENEYISLTDIAKYRNDNDPRFVIQNWMRNRNTVEFLAVWEELHNLDFNRVQFEAVRSEAGLNRFVMTPTKWIEQTNAIGIVSKAGRYGGGTYAHSDIAMAFATWISPEFQLYIMKDYRRLKQDENSRLSLDWNLNRALSKVNYRIHTDAVKENLIPPELTSEQIAYNVNLKFKIGEKLAVVGMNGSGKTTFIKLLCRLYDPTEGEILLNNVDIRKYDYKEYMSIFSVVFQDFKLFSFGLGQNVSASLNYNEELAKKCLEKAGFYGRLQSMKKGLETSIYKDLDEEGVEISGGEAQKIALARALYKNAPFIILDEPTAALDPIAEYEVYSKFNEIVQDKTAIYISHRLSSCRFCDVIAVFDGGQIVQRGVHDRLLQDTQGKYYELWNAQAQYYT